jgi:hypothetical protein
VEKQGRDRGIGTSSTKDHIMSFKLLQNQSGTGIFAVLSEKIRTGIGVYLPPWKTVWMSERRARYSASISWAHSGFKLDIEVDRSEFPHWKEVTQEAVSSTVI